MARNTLIRHAYGITEIDFTDLLRGECKESDNSFRSRFTYFDETKVE